MRDEYAVPGTTAPSYVTSDRNLDESAKLLEARKQRTRLAAEDTRTWQVCVPPATLGSQAIKGTM